MIRSHSYLERSSVLPNVYPHVIFRIHMVSLLVGPTLQTMFARWPVESIQCFNRFVVQRVESKRAPVSVRCRFGHRCSRTRGAQCHQWSYAHTALDLLHSTYCPSFPCQQNSRGLNIYIFLFLQPHLCYQFLLFALTQNRNRNTMSLSSVHI